MNTLSIVGLPYSEYLGNHAIINKVIQEPNAYTLHFVPEPENKFEKQGVAIRVDLHVQDSKRVFKLGYIPSRNKVERHMIYQCKVHGNDWKVCSPEAIVKQVERFSSIVIAPQPIQTY